MVLAIAGVIFGLIFLAVPALQRNGANNRRKQDVAAILAAASRFELNHSGNFPACNPGSCAADGSLLRYTKLSGYEVGGVGAYASVAGAGPPPVVTDLATVSLYNYYKCDTTNQGNAISSGAGYNDIVALYAIEIGGGSGTAPRCEQL